MAVSNDYKGSFAVRASGNSYAETAVAVAATAVSDIGALGRSVAYIANCGVSNVSRLGRWAVGIETIQDGEKKVTRCRNGAIYDVKEATILVAEVEEDMCLIECRDKKKNKEPKRPALPSAAALGKRARSRMKIVPSRPHAPPLPKPRLKPTKPLFSPRTEARFTAMETWRMPPKRIPHPPEPPPMPLSRAEKLQKQIYAESRKLGPRDQMSLRQHQFEKIELQNPRIRQIIGHKLELAKLQGKEWAIRKCLLALSHFPTPPPLPRKKNAAVERTRKFLEQSNIRAIVAVGDVQTISRQLKRVALLKASSAATSSSSSKEVKNAAACSKAATQVADLAKRAKEALDAGDQDRSLQLATQAQRQAAEALSA